MMNLFARILSHGFALVVVALLAIGLIYRGELFPELALPDYLSHGDDASRPGGHDQTPELKPTQTDTGQAATAISLSPGPGQLPVAEIDRNLAGQVAVDAMPDQAVATPAPTPAAVPAPESATTVQPVTTAVGDTGERTVTVQQTEEEFITAPAALQAMPVQPSAVVTDTAAQEPGAAAVDRGDTTRAEIAEFPDSALPATASEEQLGDAGSTAVPRPAPAATDATTYKILAAAREAYWLRDYTAAEQKYQQLIALDPDNPDGYGELGNMYFSQGDWDKASSSYYDAGARLVAQGLTDQARQLVEVIRGLNGSQAGDLEQIINESESGTP